MARRMIEILLLIVAGFGGYRAWETGRERARLEAIHDRLIRMVGDLPVGDPSKVLIRAQETGDPLDFAWSIHLPANYRIHLTHAGGGIGPGTPLTKARDFIARFHIREDNEGQLQSCVFFDDTNMKVSLGNARLADLFRTRKGEILVDRLGVGATAVIEPADPAVLLRLAFPESLREAATKAHPGHFDGGKALILDELTLNPKPSKP